MRISDWSSDVCSSDLVGIVPASRMRVQRTAGGAVVVGEHSSPVRRNVVAGARDIADILAPAPDIGAAPDAEREHIVAIGIMPGEIGRASCRERVCQYV